MVLVHLLRQRAGATLVEIMTAVAVIGVAVAMATPNFVGNLPTYRLRGASKAIMADMLKARMRAASLNRQYRLSFMPGSESYVLEMGDKSSGSSTWTADGPVRNFTDPAGGCYHKGIDIVSASPGSVIIDPTGLMTATSVTLRNSKAETATITSTIAGQIKVH